MDRVSVRDPKVIPFPVPPTYLCPTADDDDDFTGWRLGLVWVGALCGSWALMIGAVWLAVQYGLRLARAAVALIGG